MRSVSNHHQCTGPTYQIGPRVALAALNHGCHYIDPGGSSFIWRALQPFHQQIRSSDLSFVLSAGWIPGLLEVLVRHSSELASAYLERPGFLRVYFGDSSEWSDTGFRDIIEVFRDRIGSGMCYFENGKSRWPTPSQVAPVVDLPPPLGVEECTCT